jgi:hypothetical protein
MSKQDVSKDERDDKKASCPWCTSRYRCWASGVPKTSSQQFIDIAFHIPDWNCRHALRGGHSAGLGLSSCVSEERSALWPSNIVSGAFNFIVIDRDGHQRACRWRRRELLRELRSASRVDQKGDVRSRADGERNASETPSTDQTECHSLQARDLRLLNPAYRDEPVFLIRSQLVCIALDRHLFAMIQPGRLLLQHLVCPEAERIVYQLRQRIRKQLCVDRKPFETIAVEAVIAFSCESLERRMTALEPAIENRLTRMARRPTRKHLEQFRLLKRELAQVAAQAQRYHAALERTLDDDLPWHVANMAVEAISLAESAWICSELESFLEYGIQKLHSWARHANALSHRVGSLEQVIETKLSTAQIRLWSFDTLVHLFTVSMFLMAIPSDFLGMSIWIPVYDNTVVFWPWCLATSLTLLAGFGLFAIGFWLLRRQGLLFGLFSRVMAHQAAASVTANGCHSHELSSNGTLSYANDNAHGKKHSR